MKKILVAAVLTALTSPVARAEEAAAAEPAAEHSSMFKLGIGLGYGIPMGNAQKDEKLSDLYAGELPIEIEASYKITHDISAGLYGGYAVGFAASDISDRIGSISTLRLGIQGEYEFGALAGVLPYVGLRVGYVSETIDSKGESVGMTGWEYATVLVGADYKLTPSAGFGLFASLALGQYTGHDGHEVADQAMHQWLTIGMRGTYDL